MLKQRLMMASSNRGPAGPSNLLSFGSNINGTTAQNTGTGNTLVPTLISDNHNGWVKVCVSTVTSNVNGAMAFGLLSNGTIWSCGNNNTAGANSGTAGQGSNSNNYLKLTQIGTSSNWEDIACTRYGGLAVNNLGELYSWGLDAYGELGHGGGGAINVTPTRVGTGTDWYRVYAGLWTSFIVKTSGEVYALGLNNGYATGLNISTGSTTTPTLITGHVGWVNIAVGAYGAIGILTTGEAYSWGSDFNGELCQGTVGVVLPNPTQIGSGTNWVYAATDCALGNFSFLIQDIAGSRTLWTAGNNQNYCTGRGTNSGNTSTLTQVGTDQDWLSVTCLNDATSVQQAAVGIRTTGKAYSWGSNSAGKTGQNTTTGTTNNPTQIGTSTSYVGLSISNSQNVAFLIV